MRLFLLSLFLLPNFAHSKPGPCRADIEKFCHNVKPGGGRIVQCLKVHKEELSPACKKRGKKLRAGGKRAHAACKADIEKFCHNVKPGGGRIIQCLKTHQAELSPACKQQGKKFNKMKGALKAACGADVERLCPQVKPGGGRILQCLREQKEQLSQSCREFAQRRRKRLKK